MPSSRYIAGQIPWYSFLIVSGVVLAIVIAIREERNAGLKKDTVLDLSLWILPLGIIGARIYYVAFSWNEFRNDFASVFRVWEGGIAIYGALIAGFVTILLFSRIRRINPLTLCDIVAPGVVLAQAVGRWGNFFNMEAYGSAVTNPSLQFFPFAVLIPSDTVTPWHMATFFYESLWNILVFIFLIVGRRRLFRRTGDVFFSYAFMYSCGRFVIEEFRKDSLLTASSVRISQVLGVVICEALLVYYFSRLRRRTLIKTVLFALSFMLFVAVFCSCTGLIRLPSPTSLIRRFLILGSFSVLCIVSFLVFYGRSKPEEVIYAVDRS